MCMSVSCCSYLWLTNVCGRVERTAASLTRLSVLIYDYAEEVFPFIHVNGFRLDEKKNKIKIGKKRWFEEYQVCTCEFVQDRAIQTNIIRQKFAGVKFSSRLLHDWKEKTNFHLIFCFVDMQSTVSSCRIDITNRRPLDVNVIDFHLSSVHCKLRIGCHRMFKSRFQKRR